MKEFWCAFALAIILEIPAGQAWCPDGFIEFIPSEIPMPTCLKFAMDKKREWHEAKAYCESLTSVLAWLDDDDLHWQVIDHIHKNPDWLDEAFHIGCTDEVTEGKWLWIDGRNVTLGPPHWFWDQPGTDKKENYGCLYYDDFLYHSCRNGQTMYTICRF